jgi:hypothetical protein
MSRQPKVRPIRTGHAIWPRSDYCLAFVESARKAIYQNVTENYRQRDTHHGLDRNIDSLCATAFDFERLLEFSFTTKQYSAQRPTIVLL